MTPTNHGPWSLPGITQRLIELHGLSGVEQLSMEAIAQKLSKEFAVQLTKNAVIGRSHRLRLELRDNVPFVRKKVERKMTPRRRVDAPIPPLDAIVKVNDETLTLYQLGDGDCHWPLGEMQDLPPFQYCGKEALFGRPYCQSHSRIAYNTPGKVWG
jgi:GcrA cell cycle regulator